MNIEKAGLQPFRFPVADAGFRNSMLELKVRDGFAWDNRVYFSDERYGKLQLLLLNRPSSEQRLKDVNYYLMKGFQVLEERLPLKVTQKEPRYWKSFSGDDTDVVMLIDPPFLSEEEGQFLKKYVNEGGDLVIVAGAHTHPGVLEDSLGGILPAKLKEVQATDYKLREGNHISKGLYRFKEMTFRARWLFYRLSSKAKAVVRYEDGAAFWVKAEHGRGSIHVISSPFTLAWSDAVVLGDFPQLLINMLSEISSKWKTDRQGLRLQMGMPFPAGLTSIRNVLQQGEISQDHALPGLYECTTDKGETMVLSCNFDPKSEAPRSPVGLEDIDAKNISGQDIQRKYRLDKWVLLSLVLLLCAETWYLTRISTVRVS